MNYPVWELATLGGGTLIAVISILHVYVAHFAVGGGMFIWLTDLKGFRENNSPVHDYLKKYTWFFLLLTMVFGAVTGVGIWFVISLVNPSGTSTLIHNFVFAWAIEWVFFLGEIISLLVYYYKFDTLGRQNRLRVAFIYFLLAWLSLFAINGILAFMLTPGSWIENRSFWCGFFNRSFFSSLFLRSFLSAMFAGVFSFVTSLRLEDEDVKRSMISYAQKWIFYSGIGLIVTSFWYYLSIPAELRMTSFYDNPQTPPMVISYFVSIAVLLGCAVYIGKTGKESFRRYTAGLLIAAGLVVMGSFEYVREISRKPYVIQNYMYSSSILRSDMDKLNSEGFLRHAKWATVREINKDNEIQAGRELCAMQCLSCHTVGGIRNDIIPRTEHFTYEGLISQLTGQGKILTYMPPFIGTDEEKSALAKYLYTQLHNQVIHHEEASDSIAKKSKTASEVEKKAGSYRLLVWNKFGMQFVINNNDWIMLTDAGTVLQAQLIKKGDYPENITEGVMITYRGEDIKGKFTYNDNTMAYTTDAIRIMPYKKDSSYDPYPLITVEAYDAGSSELLASTRVAAPVTTEMGCRTCHGGPWEFENLKSGLSDATAFNILKAHDRINDTDLIDKAESGKPEKCSNCHADQPGGDGKRLSLSAAIHGFHANYMHFTGGDACGACHPSSSEGITRSLRGIHYTVGLSCVECHGSMTSHALALLKKEAEQKNVKRLVRGIKDDAYPAYEEIKARLPWKQQPDCLTCHVDFNAPENYDAFNRWTDEDAGLFSSRTDDIGIRCPACHGAAHVLYPAVNPMDKNRDNLQPLQYTGKPYPLGSDRRCTTCHGGMKQDSLHHPHMLKMFRNRQ